MQFRNPKKLLTPVEYLEKFRGTKELNRHALSAIIKTSPLTLRVEDKHEKFKQWKK